MRNILVISNKNNTKKMIQSEAVTRGDLERELNDLGIDTEDMSFFEGFTRTDLVDSNSQLPQKAMYKGQATTDLIITLTPNSIKKVANGAAEKIDRNELYREVNERELKDDVKDRFGKPYTSVSSVELRDFINEYNDSMFDDDDDEDCQEVCEPCCCCSKATPVEEALNAVRSAIDTLQFAESMISKAMIEQGNSVEDLSKFDVDDLVKRFGK